MSGVETAYAAYKLIWSSTHSNEDPTTRASCGGRRSGPRATSCSSACRTSRRKLPTGDNDDAQHHHQDGDGSDHAGDRCHRDRDRDRDHSCDCAGVVVMVGKRNVENVEKVVVLVRMTAAPKVPVKEDEFEEVLEKAAPLTPSSAGLSPVIATKGWFKGQRPLFMAAWCLFLVTPGQVLVALCRYMVTPPPFMTSDLRNSKCAKRPQVTCPIRLRAYYAVPGTGKAYGATSRLCHAQVDGHAGGGGGYGSARSRAAGYAIALRACYVLAGTHLARMLLRVPDWPCVPVWYSGPNLLRMLLRARYVLCGCARY
eukprot:360610-Rhodomonas_salina.2